MTRAGDDEARENLEIILGVPWQRILSTFSRLHNIGLVKASRFEDHSVKVDVDFSRGCSNYCRGLAMEDLDWGLVLLKCIYGWLLMGGLILYRCVGLLMILFEIYLD